MEPISRHVEGLSNNYDDSDSDSDSDDDDDAEYIGRSLFDCLLKIQK